jgi:DNA segregation ATPase FtsK/SpoIIIE-like protein
VDLEGRTIWIADAHRDDGKRFVVLPVRSLAPFISFCRCGVEHESGRLRRVKHWRTALAILAALSVSLALAEDFKTLNGKEYKNATVTRVEADGIIVRTAGGISKIYFVELPKDVADKWLAPIHAAERAAEEKRIKEQQAAKEKRAKEQQAAEEKRAKEQQAAEEKRAKEQRAAEEKRAAAERESAEADKGPNADLKQSLEQFQAAEQRATKAYEGAAKGTLSGQVFVSSRGGENFKLGAVEVGLFARDAIDTLLPAIKKNADYKIEQLRREVAEAKAAKDQAEANEKAAHGADAFNAVLIAQSRYIEIKAKLNFCYSGGFYFALLQSPIRTAETDADGRFLIEVPKTGAFVIAAQAKRSVGDDTEHYYWLQPVSLWGSAKVQSKFIEQQSHKHDGNAFFNKDAGLVALRQ